MPSPTSATAMPIARPMTALLSALVAASLAASALFASAAPTLAHGGDGLRDAANQVRTDHDVAPVFGTALLDDIATHRASQMVAIDRLEHDIDYVTDRLNRAGTCWRGVGEIIAWERGYPDYDPSRPVEAWWNSPTHHEIMMGEAYNAAGGAWKTAPDGAHYSVMVFVVLCGASTSAEREVSLLRADDHYRPNRQLVLSGGRHTGFRFDVDGNVLSSTTHRYDHSVVRRAAARAYVDGVAYLKVSTGTLSGYWVRESPRAYVRGMSHKLTFAEPHKVVFAEGRYVGKRFGRLGGVYASRERRYWHRNDEIASARAVINGRDYVKLASGRLDGHWVLDTKAVDLH